MAIENRPTAWRNDARDQLFVLFSVAASSVINTTFTTNHTFNRAFLSGTTPMVFGTNIRKAGAGAATARVVANATAMSLYVTGLSPTPFTDETVIVSVTLEGGY